MTSIDQQTGAEHGEKVPDASIRMEFFRHDDKAKPIGGQSDSTIRLTEKGRIHASEVGEAKDPKANMALAMGSERDRAIETALRQMLAKEGLDLDTSLEEIRTRIGEEVKYGKKDVVNKNLNFAWDTNPEFKRIAYARYLESKDALRFLVEDSDELAERLKDKTSTTYSRQAGNIAELVQKYIKILPNWQKIVEANSDKYPENSREMQRFLGSHQTVTESFLMKVIEKMDGHQAVLEFIESQPDKNGFGFSEGYTVKVEMSADGEPIIVIEYKDKKWNVSPEIIQQIIDERDALNKEVETE